MIEDILDEFDFHKVQKVMKALEWGYWDSETPPRISDLRKMARRLLKSVEESSLSPYTVVASGGFKAERYWYGAEPTLYLSFVVEEGNSEDLG